MSTKHVRFGTQSVKSTTRSGGTRSRSKATKKVKSKKKPDWDTTVRDLSVHKLSKEEQERRRQSFQSKNAEAAKHDLYEKAKGSFDLDSSGNLRPSPVLGGLSRNHSKLTALHQALHGKELHDVLAESDRALAVVRDLFGDDPKRYTCQPNVTVAPHIITDKGKLERTILESSEDGPRPTVLASPGGIRDESVRELAPRKPALNELPSPTSAELEDDATLTADDDDSVRAESAELTPHGRGYQPSIDLTRFQKLIESEERTFPNGREETHHKMPHNTRRHKIAEAIRSGQRGEDYTPLEKYTRRHIHSNQPPLSVSNSQYVDQYSSKGGRPRTEPSSQDCLGEHATKEQITIVREEDNDSCSVAGMSDLSSIPPGGDGRVNVTVDSEVSSVQSPMQLHVGGSGVSEQTNAPVVAGGGSESYQAEVERRKGQVMSSLPQHPLHVVHRMAPSSHRKVTRERATDHGHQDKVHSQLQTLEQMVQKLEDELSAYEESNNLTVSLNDITNTPLNQSPTHKPRSSGSLGSITKSLLSSMTKMMSYLRQSEVQLKGEVAVRVQMLQTMTEQQNLMDSLATDLIKLRSENVALNRELTDLKTTSLEQMRKMQDDFADVHKKLSSLAVNHAYQTPPISYLPPSHLPLLPPHLLQTPPPFPPTQASADTEQSQPQDFPHSNTTPASAHNVNVSTSMGSVSQLTAPNTPHISLPSAGDVLSQLQSCARDSPRQSDEENEGSAPQYKALKHGVESSELVGRAGAKHAHFTSNVQSNFTSSNPVTHSLNSIHVAPMTSVAASLAPPPLSEALKVPGFDLPPFASQQSNSSKTMSTATVSSSNIPASKPAFDVEAFISSLRKNQPHTSITSAGSQSSSLAVPVSKGDASASLSLPHPTAQSQVVKLHPPVDSQKDRTIPAVDLSVSLLSSMPEDGDNGRDYSSTTETSEQTGSSEQQTDSTIHPPILQRELPETGGVGHPGASTNSSQIGHGAHVSLPPGYVVQHQGLTSGKVKPGWFSLTSHLSHS